MQAREPTEKDFAAAREALEHNPNLAGEDPDAALLLLAKRHASLGRSKFRLYFGLREPRWWLERLQFQDYHHAMSDQEYREQYERFATRPVDIEMLDWLFTKIVRKLEHYSNALKSVVDIVHSQSPQTDRGESERRIYDQIRRMSSKVLLDNRELKTALEFLSEVRLESQLGTVQLGEFSAANAVHLALLIMRRAKLGWKKCRSTADRSQTRPEYLYPATASDLFWKYYSKDLPSPQTINTLLEHEQTAARMVLRRRQEPCATPQVPSTESLSLLARILEKSNLADPAPVVSAYQEQLPENIFRRCGGAWQVRYKGKATFTVLPWLGATYIHYLLMLPGKPRSAIDIVCAAAIDCCDEAISAKEAMDLGLKSASNPMVASLGDVSDWKALRDYRAEALDLRETMDEARRDNNNVLERQCENDLAMIVAKINEAVGIGGKLKQANDKRKNIQDSFRNNVKRVIDKQIKDTDPALAAHLDKAILFGIAPRYVPEDGIAWETRPVKNDLAEKAEKF